MQTKHWDGVLIMYIYIYIYYIHMYLFIKANKHMGLYDNNKKTTTGSAPRSRLGQAGRGQPEPAG